MKAGRRTMWVLAAFAPLAAQADKATMTPGLYEYSVKMEMPGMPFAMPAITTKRCLTQADLDQNKQYQNEKDAECKVTNLKQSAGKASFDIACKDGTTGKADYTFTDSGMTGKTVMTKDGQPMAMNMTARNTGACK